MQVRQNKTMSPERIINNARDNNLYQALSSAITDDTTAVDIEVGYFYLCGFELLAKKLEKIPVRILVGSYIDPDAIPDLILQSTKQSNLDLGRFQPRVIPPSKTKRVDALAEGIKKLANQTSIFDAPEAQTAYHILEQKLEDGSLEIKMTEEHAHGKYYIVHKKPHGVVYMGSSNFTYNGLIGQQEVNEVLDNEQKYNEYAENFNTRWNDGRNIAVQEKGKSDMFLNKIKNELWMNVVPRPYAMYVRLLDEIFGTEDRSDIVSPRTASRGQYSDYSYQLDAIKMALARLKNFDGAIVADVVGLGKSVIASAVAANLTDLKPIIIAPPHLVSMWEDYAEEFRLSGCRVFSTGKIEEAYEKYQNSRDPLLLILDEAHRYRNEETYDYQMLHQLARSHADNKVLVLSATPFNNDPRDIFALIKLFQTPGAATLRTVDNLSIKFMELEKQYKTLRRKLSEGVKDSAEQQKLDAERDGIASELRRLIEPLIIRRSRIDLNTIKRYKDDLAAQGVQFAKMADPILREYELGELTGIYLDTIARIEPDSKVREGLTGARYMPTTYVKDVAGFIEKYPDLEDIRTAQKNVASFMRKLLVMRFESSRAAFQSTLGNVISSHERILEWAEKKQKVPISKKAYIPSPDDTPDEDTEASLETEVSAEEETAPASRRIIFVELADLEDTFVADVTHDRDVLKNLYEQWFGAASAYSKIPDPKLSTLLQDIKAHLQQDPTRKIVVFSMYADTVNYVGKALQDASIPTFVYTSANSRADRMVVRENFDAGLPAEKQKNDFKVIVATDALSEGISLHRAGRIINYDIPYNPTRVVQRVGRINRISKKMFDELYIDNYFPTDVGEAEVNVRGISTLKMKIFNSVVGSDSRTLTPDEDPVSFFKDEFERATAEDMSWDAPYRDAYDAAKRNDDLMAEAQRLPMRSRLIRVGKDQKCTVGVGMKGENIICAVEEKGEVRLVNTEDALKFFVATQEEKGEPADNQFDQVFEMIKARLFEKPPVAQMSGNRTKVMQILRSVRDESQYGNYCDDLMRVVSELDDLSDGQLKTIIKEAADSDLSPDDLVKKIMEIAPERQVEVSLERQNKEQRASNVLLFTQEHRA